MALVRELIRPASSSRFIEFDTVYDALEASLLAGDTIRISWTGDAFVDDGEIVSRWDGAEFHPPILSQTEVPAGIMGEGAWTVENGSASDLTFDSDGRPVLATSAAAFSDTRSGGGPIVQLDTRLSLNSGQFTHFITQVNTSFSSSINENRINVYLTDLSTGDFVYGMMKYFSSWVVVCGTLVGASLNESFTTTSSYSNNWDGRYIIIIGGMPDEADEVRARFAGISPDPSPPSRSRSVSSFNNTLLTPEWRVTHNNSSANGTLTIRSVYFNQIPVP
jgi:hypothetical protein